MSRSCWRACETVISSRLRVPSTLTRLALRLGGQQRGQVVDDVEVVGGDEVVEQGEVADVADGDAVAARLDGGVGGVQVQGDESRRRQFRQPGDESVADLAVGARDE